MIQKMVKNADHHEKVPISYRLSAIDSCWTCLCLKCLNPELKLKALTKGIQDNCLKWNDTFTLALMSLSRR